MVYVAENYFSIDALENINSLSFAPTVIVMTLVTFLICSRVKLLASDSIAGVLFFTFILPATYYIGVTQLYALENFLPQLSVLLLSFLIFHYLTGYSFRIKSPSTISLSPVIFDYLLLAILILGGLLTIILFGLSSIDISLDEDYERRLASRNILTGLFGYFYSFFAGLFIPFAAIYAAVTKKFHFLLMALICSTICFMATGGKGVFLSPLLGFFGGLFFSRYKFYSPYYIILLGSLIFFLICIIEFIFFETLFLNQYVFRRIFYVPSQLSFWYFDYFSNNPVYNMADSIFGQFITDNKVDYPKARLIGGIYAGKYQMSANVNFLAASYGDWGLIGMPIFVTIAAFFAKYINNIQENKNSTIIIIYCFFIGFVWAQTQLHTSLLSNGIFLGFLLMLLIPKNNKGLV